jgi:ribosome-associated protein
VSDPLEHKSRSQQKRESEALQRLGEELTRLPSGVLAHFPLPTELREAVLDARGLTSHGALRRQHQLIGKIMREVDSEPIARAMEQWRAARNSQNEQHHAIETLRSELVAGDDNALRRVIAEHPTADAGLLRQLVNNARQAHQQGASGKASRALFRYLREITSANEPTEP